MPVILQKWEELIAGALSRLGEADLSEEEITNIIGQSAAFSNGIRNLLVEAVVDRESIRDKQLFVQVHQAILIRLLNKVFECQQTGGQQETAHQAYQAFSLHLEQALNFIEDFFSNYFDRREKAPAPYFYVSTAELCRQVVLLKEKFKKTADVDPALVTILENNFCRYCNGEKSSATYIELAYQRDLLNELLSTKTPATDAGIREVLFYFNFNEDDYVTFLYRKISTDLEEQPTRQENLATLRFEQKIINQYRTKLNTVFNEGMPALKEQVTQWIGEEIRFWEATPVSETGANSDSEPEEKIKTALSVARLSLLLRLMVIDKIITNRVVAQMLRIVARMVSTEKVESISFQSLETKYHNPDRGTISAVKDMLFRWLNILNRL